MEDRIQRSFSLDISQYQRLLALKETSGLPINHIVRVAIEKYLIEQENPSV